MIHKNETGVYTLMYQYSPKPEQIQAMGGKISFVSRFMPIVTARIPDKKCLSQLKKDPNLVYISRDHILSLPFYRVKKILSPTVMGANLRRMSKKVVPWNVLRVLGRGRLNTGKGIRVGVIDTGIDLNHPNLARNIKGGVNIISPSKSPQDDNGHGTHIAGTIGALHHRVGVIGVAPHVSLYAIKVLDSSGTGSLTNLIRGIEWGIANRMHVLNISISGGRNIIPILEKVVKEATDRGIIIVAAAGNSGLSSGQGDTVEIPARIPDTIAVAALNKLNKRAPFSATGQMVDIAAPGVDILSTYHKKQYAVLNGTSMATAHVSGVMAIYRAAYPHKSVAELKRLMARKAIDLPPKGKDPLTGYGLIQVN
ncbi:S8 family peptidase [Thermoflavimicrobium dichotomicum]|uniref:Subtilisin/minor extracellular protease Epr n=1 Tax=Thermoflavimicrobium dichotomicum TaxID=46223 RepID=A0A1I3MQB9_9BACL|nr:S8 family peptidase [Thermoflavimicrobium dichotomicum]SFI98886.1 subtilisin/minor extracellular protease Epr [Thermoflavimicrobium dichotomicum]